MAISWYEAGLGLMGSPASPADACHRRRVGDQVGGDVFVELFIDVALAGKGLATSAGMVSTAMPIPIASVPGSATSLLFDAAAANERCRASVTRCG